MAKLRQVVNRILVCELFKVQFKYFSLCNPLAAIVCLVNQVKLTVKQHWIQYLFMIWFWQISQVCEPILLEREQSNKQRWRMGS